MPENTLGHIYVATENGQQKFIGLDNAGTTPPFTKVVTKVIDFLTHYGAAHRSSGVKAEITTKAIEDARNVVKTFFNADDSYDVIFTKNATEAINKVANFLKLTPDNIVITTKMEHHSNILPWSTKCKVEFVNVDADGRLDMEHLQMLLTMHYGFISLVAVTGASNVTGHINDINKIAGLAHAFDTKVLIDASQLAVHSEINMQSVNCINGDVDFLVASGHKLHAPFGAGVLVGLKEMLEQFDPDYSGGGTVKSVIMNDVIWEESPYKHEAGTPNAVGIVAIAEAMKIMNTTLDKSLYFGKADLYKLISNFSQNEEITIYGGLSHSLRCPILPFNIKGMSPYLVAEILGNDFGIGVRAGCFCAHPYVAHLLGRSVEEQRASSLLALTGNKSDIPGMVRISMGVDTLESDINAVIRAVNKICENKDEYKKQYILNNATGVYEAVNKRNITEKYFKL